MRPTYDFFPQLARWIGRGAKKLTAPFSMAPTDASSPLDAVANVGSATSLSQTGSPPTSPAHSPTAQTPIDALQMPLTPSLAAPASVPPATHAPPVYTGAALGLPFSSYAPLPAFSSRKTTAVGPFGGRDFAEDPRLLSLRPPIGRADLLYFFETKASAKDIIDHATEHLGSIHRRTLWGESPLELAVRYHRTDVALQLLTMGANPFEIPEQRDILGLYLKHRPFEGAMMRNMNAVVERCLLDLSARYGPDLTEPLLSLQHDWFILESETSNPCRSWRKGATYMHLAAATDNTALIELLARYGLRADAPDNTGFYPLEVLAIKKGSAQSALHLLQAGGSVERLGDNLDRVDRATLLSWAQVFSDFERTVLLETIGPAPTHLTSTPAPSL